MEKLLTDDGQRRLELAERAAREWGRAEEAEEVRIASEHMVITPHGLLYAAQLEGNPRKPRPLSPTPTTGRSRRSSESSSRHPLCYLATSRASFDQLVDHVHTAQLRQDSTAAVDSRFGHELEFPCPLDAALRRALESFPVLVWI
ncbi:hypothetical protein [Streptomyces sp. NPDC058955]|uniref:hypothetical protein n=1 Tax=Streptomyces sp. NPDC058955 TaxID=3346678 RepID=UPI0036AAC8A5